MAGKYVTKAENGYHHSYAFTFKDVQVIRARPTSTAIVDANCRRCHEAETATIRVNEGPTPTACVRCHRGAGHVF